MVVADTPEYREYLEWERKYRAEHGKTVLFFTHYHLGVGDPPKYYPTFRVNEIAGYLRTVGVTVHLTHRLDEAYHLAKTETIDLLLCEMSHQVHEKHLVLPLSERVPPRDTASPQGLVTYWLPDIRKQLGTEIPTIMVSLKPSLIPPIGPESFQESDGSIEAIVYHGHDVEPPYNWFTPMSDFRLIMQVLYRSVPRKRKAEKLQAEVAALQAEIAELKAKIGVRQSE